MDHTADRLLPAGRGTARWFLFLVFYHLVPVPWFMFVAAGLAPGSFLLALSVAGLFNPDFDSLIPLSPQASAALPVPHMIAICI